MRYSVVKQEEKKEVLSMFLLIELIYDYTEKEDFTFQSNLVLEGGRTSGNKRMMGQVRVKDLPFDLMNSLRSTSIRGTLRHFEDIYF